MSLFVRKKVEFVNQVSELCSCFLHLVTTSIVTVLKPLTEIILQTQTIWFIPNSRSVSWVGSQASGMNTRLSRIAKLSNLKDRGNQNEWDRFCSYLLRRQWTFKLSCFLVCCSLDAALAGLDVWRAGSMPCPGKSQVCHHAAALTCKVRVINVICKTCQIEYRNQMMYLKTIFSKNKPCFPFPFVSVFS